MRGADGFSAGCLRETQDRREYQRSLASHTPSFDAYYVSFPTTVTPL
jgi:hypothetical protein